MKKVKARKMAIPPKKGFPIVKVILFVLLGILSGILGYLGFDRFQNVSKYQVSHYIFFVVLGLGALILLQIIVGSVWKPARKWGLLALSSGMLYTLIVMMIGIETLSLKPVIILLMGSIIAAAVEAAIGLLVIKYRRMAALSGKILLILIVGFLAFIMGYDGIVTGGSCFLRKLRYARPFAVALVFALPGLVALGIWWKSARKWGVLAILALFTIAIPVVGQVVDYLSVQNFSRSTLSDGTEVQYTGGGGNVFKPIIYLYPADDTMVTVRLGNPENLSYTYPVYQQEWKVEAFPDGTLFDPKTNRIYYALYWEGISNREKKKLEEGFVVPAEETIPFLEKKLSILGLTDREANEFIVYWLPRLGESKYNFIRFQTRAEQDEYMPLSVDPKPDTMIRVMMEYRGLNKEISVSEQKLEPTPIREGFTLVEWGGTPI